MTSGIGTFLSSAVDIGASSLPQGAILYVGSSFDTVPVIPCPAAGDERMRSADIP
jgi:hypothetical protein